MSGTSIWVPISSAVAALIGAGFGAMLQGRYGVSGWRRQIRLEAYTKFMNTIHDYDAILFEVLNTISESNFDEGRQKLEEIHWRLASAATSAIIAGPRSIDETIMSILNSTRTIYDDTKDRDLFISTAYAWRKNRSYEKWQTWVRTSNQFMSAARTFLKTE